MDERRCKATMVRQALSLQKVCGASTCGGWCIHRKAGVAVDSFLMLSVRSLSLSLPSLAACCSLARLLCPPPSPLVLYVFFPPLPLYTLLFIAWRCGCTHMLFSIAKRFTKKNTAGAACASAPRPTSAWIENCVRLAQKVQVDPCISVGVHL